MKFQLSAALMGLAATVVSAQDTQTAPFNLQIKGTNKSSKINGSSISSEYFFNYTGYNKVGNDEAGTLVWNLPYTDPNGNPASESQAMGLYFDSTSNVAAPMFGFSQFTFLVGFNSEGELFGYNYVDDSKFIAGKAPTDLTPKAYYQWAVCWQYFTGYYYQSVAWVLAGAPHNPTCEPVEITKVNIKA
ncbi:hypothetical protein FHL15_004253 [Xylaria flabelliformis]|uniref:Uncharacterized protein n=1 Tax=Xylaria flabelliformis TaxID=2512241 RepID=A0A553I3N1_9PEZI|nr:hypothetical protein FHL15_004253 [Xylaria flabelliformis]